MGRNSNVGPVTKAHWDRTWGKVGTRLFMKFLDAKTEDDALAVWRETRVLQQARHQLAAALTNDDPEAIAQLNPINQTGATAPATPREANTAA